MKHTITAFVHYEKPWLNDDEQEVFKVYPFDMSRTGAVLVGTQKIEVEVPDDFDPIPKQIAALEEEKRQAMLKLARELADIDDRISKLQALPMAPRTVDADAEEWL